MSVKRSFQVLVPLTHEGDVFDRLLPVKDMATGEQGLLLCSHHCRWPEKLIPQATWLEGCFTPAAFRDDPRLALGYHPTSVTRWRYQDGILRLSTQTPEEVVRHRERQLRGQEEEALLREERFRERGIGPGADLRDLNLGAADLRGANLRGANLRGAILRWASLERADLRGANLSEADLREANLSEADLREASLEGADLREANLRGAKFERANLSRVDLRGVDLRGNNLEGADLRNTDFSGADLSGANLRGADLRWNNHQEANLEGANLEGANREPPILD